MEGASTFSSAASNEKQDKQEGGGTGAKNIMVLAATNRP